MKYLLSVIMFISLILPGCSSEPKTKTGAKSIETKLAKLVMPIDNAIISKSEPLEIQLDLRENAAEKIDSIGVYFNDKFITTIENTQGIISVDIENLRLGSSNLFVKIFKSDGSQENKLARIKILSGKAPKKYVYEVLSEYPHDKESYTQGLLFHEGYLYESTGQRGKSKLLKLNLETGEAIQSHDLPSNYFGEGLTLLNNRLFQLTWTSGQGFIYDLNSFKPIGNFSFTGEGWGLCTNGKQLIMSNGTKELVFLNPDNFKVTRRIEATNNKGSITKLNELEYINGEIWANFYEYNKYLIYRINPQTGEVNSVIDLTGIVKKEDSHYLIDVLNGIAYDAENERLFVTGKNYPKVYEIRLVEKVD